MSFPALVQSIPYPSDVFIDRRATARHVCGKEAVSRPLDAESTLCWGAQVRNLSATGLNLLLCYPFRPGTYLAIDLQSAPGVNKTLLVRVVHVQDQTDGTWSLGCEFVKQMSESDVELML